MATYLFTASRIEKDQEGRKQIDGEGPLFEAEIEASSNQEAITKGLAELDVTHPDEDLDSLVFGACTWRS